MYETRLEPILPRPLFLARLLRHGAGAVGVIAASLAIGMAGYVAFEHLSWLDAFVNAAMLLGGMGPVGTLDSTPVKLFAALFALYSGLVFLVVAGLMLAPVFHRVLHRFHWDEKQ